VHLVPTEIRDATVKATAEGIRQYWPTAIGVIVVGLPTCLLASFAHFVLGISTPSAGLGAGVVGGASAIYRLVRR
jgi:hypothetical protein